MHELIKIVGVFAWVIGFIMLFVVPVFGVMLLILAVLLTVRNISITREQRHQELLEASRRNDETPSQEP